MTTLPDLEPAEAEMTDAEIERWADVCNYDLARKALRHYIALRRAARSVPEAGKAVDDGEEVSLTAGSPSRGAVAPYSAGIEPGPANQDPEQARLERENAAFHEWWEESGHAAEPIFTLMTENACHAAWQARAALASVPAPSGAEPVALEAAIRRIVEDAMDSAIPEPWEVSAHAAKRIVALLKPTQTVEPKP